MIEEIIYTSSERGLKSGSRGFCTVISTAGMGLTLAERLESMSGYRQAFPLNDPNAPLNPVNYSHVTLRVAGRKLNVISRVADAGQDYTGRSNKLAHHVVIDSTAPLTAGPARLLAEPGTVVEKWDGTVRNIPPRRITPPAVPDWVLLSAWREQTGDNGWAGAVAEMLVQDPSPLCVIFRPGTDTLGLVREVLDLIPPSQRWNTTFSTYFTRLLASTECQLRFVLDGTAEATALRNDARARVVDLTHSLPAASGGALVALARSGTVKHTTPATGPLAANVEPGRASPRAGIEPFTEADLMALDEDAVGQDAEPPTYSLAINRKRSPPPLETPPALTHGRSRIDGILDARKARPARARWVFSAIAAVTLLAACVPAVLFVRPWVTALPGPKTATRHAPIDSPVPPPGKQTEPAKNSSFAAKETSNAAIPTASENKSAVAAMSTSPDTPYAPTTTKSLTGDNTTRDSATATPSTLPVPGMNDTSNNIAASIATRTTKPLDTIRTRPDVDRDDSGQLLFKLPPPGSRDTQTLSCRIALNDGEDIQLGLSEWFITHMLKDTVSDLSISPPQNDPTDSNARHWIVSASDTNSGTPLTLGKYVTTITPDSAARVMTSLTFEWIDEGRSTDHGYRSLSEVVRWCPLDLRVTNSETLVDNLLFIQRAPELLEHKTLNDDNTLATGADFHIGLLAAETGAAAEWDAFLHIRCPRSEESPREHQHLRMVGYLRSLPERRSASQSPLVDLVDVNSKHLFVVPRQDVLRDSSGSNRRIEVDADGISFTDDHQQIANGDSFGELLLSHGVVAKSDPPAMKAHTSFVWRSFQLAAVHNDTLLPGVSSDLSIAKAFHVFLTQDLPYRDAFDALESQNFDRNMQLPSDYGLRLRTGVVQVRFRDNAELMRKYLLDARRTIEGRLIQIAIPRPNSKNNAEEAYWRERNEALKAFLQTFNDKHIEPLLARHQKDRVDEEFRLASATRQCLQDQYSVMFRMWCEIPASEAHNGRPVVVMFVSSLDDTKEVEQ